MTDLLSLVESRGIRMRRVGRKHGGEYAGGCPFCGDSGKKDSDRFHVWPEQRSNVCEGTYWCRQCGKRGDLVNFVMQTSGITFKDACDRLAIDLPKTEKRRTPAPSKPAADRYEPRAVASPSETWKEKARAFVNHCFDAIWENDEMIQWLGKRGIPEAAISTYGLGWNKKDYWRPRKVWGLSVLVDEKGRERRLWLAPGLVIPQIDGQTGKVTRIRIRRYGEIQGGDRYRVVPGSAMGAMVLGRGRVAMVVESELDAMAVDVAAGDLVTVIAMGSAQARPDERAAKVLKGAMEILVAFDFDDAGMKEARTWWSTHYEKARFHPVPDGKDPGEAVKAGVDLRAWVMAGLPPAFHV